MNNDERRKNDVFTGLAAHDFERAYQKGFFRAILKDLSGKKSGLLSLDKVRRSLSFKGEVDKGLQAVEIEKIIGSLNRYQDFDESFLPRQTHTRNRWQNIDKALLRGEYLPPVDLYKIGDFYFVSDGNHRVSVARQKGQKFIDAHVVELELPFTIESPFNWRSVLLKQEKANFLRRTRLDELKPDVDFTLTLAGQYHKLFEHIDVHRYFLSQNQQREIPYQEAVLSWVEAIYQPMVDVIRQQKILERFPRRTETDLYLWVIEHLAYIQQRYPSGIDYQQAATHFSRKRKSFFSEMRRRLRKLLGM